MYQICPAAENTILKTADVFCLLLDPFAIGVDLAGHDMDSRLFNSTKNNTEASYQAAKGQNLNLKKVATA